MRLLFFIRFNPINLKLEFPSLFIGYQEIQVLDFFRKNSLSAFKNMPPKTGAHSWKGMSIIIQVFNFVVNLYRYDIPSMRPFVRIRN